jgi:indolepyruvate ferredoxin oxidoreductase alpha subunit
MYPSCPHRALFFLLSKYKIKVTGDIGCYGLGVLPPFNGMDTIICMGASVTMSHGFSLGGEKAVGVIGDSTFFHTGINGLINTFYNKGVSTVFILDNSITAMTGGQINPSSSDVSTKSVDIAKIVEAIGVEYIRVIDAFNVKEIEEEVKSSRESSELRVIILRQPCIMIRQKKAGAPRHIDQSKCIKCKVCLKVGCPAITMENGQIKILQDFCLGCNVCAQVCLKGAIHE